VTVRTYAGKEVPITILNDDEINLALAPPAPPAPPPANPQ